MTVFLLVAHPCSSVGAPRPVLAPLSGLLLFICPCYAGGMLSWLASLCYDLSKVSAPVCTAWSGNLQVFKFVHLIICFLSP